MNADAPETPSPALAELARACGVAVEYTAWNGERVPSSTAAIRAALTSLGVDAHDDDACARSLADLDDLTWRRLVPPVTVVVEGTGARIPAHVPHGAPVAASLMLEHGEPRPLEQLDVLVPPRVLDGREVGRATFQVPDDLPLGWHRLEAATSGRRGRGWVVVTPARIDVPEHVRRERPWGLAAQLYSVRSERSWGIGDFGDLADLCALAAIREGADFLLINPLHAAEAVPPLEPSPYLPTSRRFLNPLYIRIEDIPEVAYVPSQHRAVIEWESERPRRANLDADLLDRDAAWRAKSAALEKIFEVERSAARQARFEAFCLREGDALEEFATWCAISEAHKGLPWPDEFRQPRSREVDAWRDEHGDRVLFFAWLQWIADEQLARAQSAAHEAGMGIGIMTDLAVGVHPQGADAWALGRVLATGMEVGAPPDMYNQHGQNWSQPPWQPRALEAAAYMPFRDVVRAAVRHSGALRVDHILGLFRQWWIPAGNRADDGVYIQFDHEALIGILALEAQRAGTIVIGEDLGTLEPWVSDYLNQRGLLGTVVALFEKGHDGGPQAPENYRADALVSVTVHDLPPTAPFLAGEHIAAREELGLIVGDAELARGAAREDRRRLADYLLERGWMPEDWEEDDLVAGVHRMAMHSPALLTAVSLTDAVGDRRSQNHPGTSTEYPNWRIPLTDKAGAVVLLDDIFDNERLQRLLEAVRTARR
ncbi:4-alpha-glucanotransferase [Demequina activiva]|uniref:4-alpha-glucanotransferase n=1 Tax=Demequina activiva TaxID=1582364 RepID=A0A919PZW8_9MICO|nr:4-alpha-glucanotransferase [Demequina activiva]GIG53416.1 4-alpha-glucanotransferase [Demequina activiva]